MTSLIGKKILAFNYFGGKYQYLEELYANFPEHLHFVDLMCGSMSVTLNKTPSKLDTANDLDGDVVNFFKVLRQDPEGLYSALYLTPVARQEYNDCYPINIPGASDVERARRFYVRCKMSFQGAGLKQHTGFNACVATSEKGMSKNVSKFTSTLEKLPEIIERLKSIQIESLDYRQILKKYDRPNTFFYVDFPYELKTRNYKKWYNHEFSDADHIDAAGHLHTINGKAMVSGYESKLYMDLYKDWRMVKLKPRGHAMSAEKKQEVIWMNY